MAFTLKILFLALFLKNVVNSELPSIYSPQNFYLDFRFPENLENRRFEGSSKLHFVATDSVQELAVHAKVSEITTVDVWSTNNSIYGKHYYSESDGYLYISLLEELKRSSAYYLLVNFSAELRKDFTGFYIVPYLNEDMETEYMMSTKFKPNYARTAFPCLDSPKYESLLHLVVTHSAEFTAISNGLRDKVESIDNATVRTTFIPTPLISSYEISLSLIKFGSTKFLKNKIEYAVHGRNEDYNSFALNASILLLSKMYRYMETVYPQGKLDILGVPTDMEITADDNLNMAVYPEGNIEFIESEQTVIEQIEVLIRIGRAIAHHYFGNHLTPASWTDLWLSDGFANWLAYKAIEETYHDLNVDQFHTVLEYQRALLVDGTEQSIPIRPSDSDDPSNEVPAHSPVLSAKSACIVRMLENSFSENTFKEVLGSYASAPRIVTSEIFLKQFQAKTGLDLDLPGSWIYQSNYPLVTVDRSYADGTVLLTQTPFNAGDSTHKWWIPFDVISANNGTFQSSNMDGYLNPEWSIDLDAVNCSNTDWIILNSQLTGFFRTNYDAQNWKLIINALLEDHTLISANNRAQLLDDAFRLAEVGISSYELALNLSIYLKNETEFSPWGTTDKFFSALQWLLSDQKEQNLFRHYVREITEAPYNTMTLSEQMEDPPVLKAARGIVTYWACQAWNEDCFCRAKEIFRSYINNDVTIEPNIRETVLCTGIGVASRDELEKTWKKLFRSKNSVERHKTVFLLGCSQNEKFLIDFLERVFKADPPPDYYQHERKQVISKIIGRGKASVSAVMKFLQNATYPQILHEESVLLSTLNDISHFVFTRKDNQTFHNVIQGMLDSQFLSKGNYEALSQRVEKNLNSVRLYQDNILKWLRLFKERFPSNETETNGGKEPVCDIEPEPEIDCGCGCACEEDVASIILPEKLVYIVFLLLHFTLFV